MDPVNLTTPEAQPEPISLDNFETSPQLTPSQTSARASKAAFGLGPKTGQTYQDIHSQLASGKETEFRQQAAATVDENRKKQVFLGQLPPEALLTGPTDPKSVIEKHYGDAFVSPNYQPFNPFMQNTFMAEASEEIPDLVAKTTATGSSMVANRTLAEHAAEEMEEAYKKQSWGMWGAQQVAGSIPFVNQLVQRGQIPTDEFHFLPGEDMEAQSEAYYRQSPEANADNIARIKKAMEKNPGLAAQYFRHLAGMSTNDRILEDQLGVLDIGAVAGGAGTLARKLSLFNKVRGATRDSVEASAQTGGVQDPPFDPDIDRMENEGGPVRDPVATASARGHGDLAEAAVQKEANNLVQEAQGRTQSQKREMDALLSEHRVDVTNLTQDPRIGATERELATRIADATHRRDMNVLAALENGRRANRTPLVEVAPDVIRTIEQSIKDDWNGVDNQLLDINTNLNPITNTYEHELKIGAPGAKLFTEEEVADNNAQINGFVKSEVGTSLPRKGQLLKMIKDGEERLAIPPTDEELRMLSEGGINPREKLRANIEAWKTEYEQPLADGYRIVQQGKGYYISYVKNMSEFTEATRTDPKTGKTIKLGYQIPINEAFATKYERKDFSLWKWFTTPAFERKYGFGETPYLRDQGILNDMRALLGWRAIRTPEETLARDVSEQRGIATFAPNVQKDVAAGIYRDIKVSRSEWKDLNRVLKLGQSYPDEDGIPGYTFRTIPELNNAYMTAVKRLPSESEVEAYFAWAHNNDLDLALRRIMLYVPKAIRGAEQFQFKVGVNKSGFFEGIQHKGLPTGEDNILVVGQTPGEEQVYKANDVKFLNKRKELADAIEKGQAQVIELVNPDLFPFRKSFPSIGNERIRYAISRGVMDRKPLSLIDQLPRRGGGHLVPDYEFYGRQAHIHKDSVSGARDPVSHRPSVRHILLGEKTLMPFADRVTGQQVIDKMNRIRELLHNQGSGRFPDLKSIKEEYRKEGLPVPWDEFHSWFRPLRNPKTGEVEPARFDTAEPFYIGEKDKGPNVKEIQSRYGKSFVDGTRSGSLARTIRVEFSGERDMHQLMTIANKGWSDKNPVWSYQPAEMVDPLATQNRALARAINSLHMNDVKLHSMNKWLTDAEPWLKAKSNEIWHAPFPFFAESGKESAFRNDTPWHIKRILLDNHDHITKFLGEPSVIDTTIHHLSQTLADSIHGVVGPKLVPRAFLASLKDPIPFVRSMTYSVDMGLGSVKQFFTQFSTHTNVYGIEPLHAPSASIGTLLHGWSTFNNSPEILNHLDMLATKMSIPGTSRYKPGQWKEARQLAVDSGFLRVDEEHALANDHPMSAKLVKSAGQNILDWGRLPFTVGASSVRSTALHTAYLKFRAKNPLGPLTRAAKAEILNDARLLDHNMSRASNSALHTGFMSVPGQFFAYDLRLAEIMLGKRISPLQKARLFAVSATAYGIPLGGLGLFGYPIYKTIQKQAIDDYGYIPGLGSRLTDFAMNGFPSMVINSITGHSYNVAKFGAKGVDYLEEAFASDATMWKILSGASGSFLGSLFSNSNNLYHSVMPEFLGGTPDMKMRAAYMAEAFRTLASYREFDNVWTAAHTGKWMSNNGTALADDISIPNAIFMGLSGVTENRFNEKYIKDELLREQDAKERIAFGLARDSWGRYLQAMKDNNPSQAQDYKMNAIHILKAAGFPDHRFNQAIAAMNRGHESTIRETNYRFMQEAPAGKEKQRFEQFKQENRK